MRQSLLLLLAVAMVLPLSGCGGFSLFGKSDLSALEVSGRYRFTEYKMVPTSGAVRDVNLLRDALGENVVLNVELDGVVSLERLNGASVEEVLSTGTYTISGREVRVSFEDGGRLRDFYMPSTIVFNGGGNRLTAEVFQQGINLEEISSDYQGVTRADVQLRIGLRKV